MTEKTIIEISEDEKLRETINELIERGNSLYTIQKNEESAPIEAGRAAWERRGIIHALIVISDNFEVPLNSIFEEPGQVEMFRDQVRCGKKKKIKPRGD